MNRKRSVSLRFLAEPSHVNFGGKVHGGMMMKWIDQAGYACAAAWSGDYCVTVYVGGIHFLSPILVGDLIEMQAQVIHTGTTSMHIAINIYAGNPRSASLRRCGHCVIVFVALDEVSKPKPVPRWVPESDHDKALQQYALRLIELRKAMEEEMHRPLVDPAEQLPVAVE